MCRMHSTSLCIQIINLVVSWQKLTHLSHSVISLRRKLVHRRRTMEYIGGWVGGHCTPPNRGTMWRAPSGMSYGRAVPSANQLLGSSPSGVRGEIPAENASWLILKATERSFLHLMPMLWVRQCFMLHLGAWPMLGAGWGNWWYFRE